VLETLPVYVPGRAPSTGDLTHFKLSSNENPYPPLPAVLKAVLESAASFNRYPDMGLRRLTLAIANRFAVDQSQVAIGTGSVGVLQQVLQAVADPGAEVIYPWRSFEAYPILTLIAGAVPVQVPLLADERHDLGAMAAAITDKTCLILICTPNNPTGNVVTRQELLEFLERVPRDVLVVIDEAYIEFVRDPDAANGLDMVRQHPNVAVLRTFSKAYGLAGLRVGFAIASPCVAEALRKTAVPFGVSALGETAAVASLLAEEDLLKRVNALVGERRRVLSELRHQGWRTTPSQGNFLWLRLGPRTADFTAACGARGIIVRAFAGEGVRITLGERPENDLFLELSHELFMRDQDS
jgi:histidinol-phosphate aminotransferase